MVQRDEKLGQFADQENIELPNAGLRVLARSVPEIAGPVHPDAPTWKYSRAMHPDPTPIPAITKQVDVHFNVRTIT